MSFVFDEATKSASWDDGSKQVILQNLRQVRYDAKRGVVLALPADWAIRKLNVYNGSGALIAQLTPPEDFHCEYLVEDTAYGVRVVCSGTNVTGDILDWYFKIDLIGGSLAKMGRAY
ncbi:hypothetical protein [Chitinimonas sp.]|uniref:hypothetical protein n=1 Tax=Chitinimonas sp. TaxID=1934313 RepID=UPI0035B49056